jgi:hypothetical protein
MKVSIYVSKNGSSKRGRGFALVRHPLSLPQNETWSYLRSGDTSEFDLPEAIEEELERRGIWVAAGPKTAARQQR